jgi:hypothetical protein
MQKWQTGHEYKLEKLKQYEEQISVLWKSIKSTQRHFHSGMQTERKKCFPSRLTNQFSHFTSTEALH